MSESKMKPRLREEELTGVISSLRDKFVRSEKYETLLFCANKKKFSFRWIEKQFVQVHPGENVKVVVFQEIEHNS